MLRNLFESSSNLREESLNRLVEVLITISGESLQLAYNTREPSLFVVAKLLETGIVNIGRVEVIWRATTCLGLLPRGSGMGRLSVSSYRPH